MDSKWHFTISYRRKWRSAATDAKVFDLKALSPLAQVLLGFIAIWRRLLTSAKSAVQVPYSCTVYEPIKNGPGFGLGQLVTLVAAGFTILPLVKTISFQPRASEVLVNGTQPVLPVQRPLGTSTPRQTSRRTDDRPVISHSQAVAYDPALKGVTTSLVKRLMSTANGVRRTRSQARRGYRALPRGRTSSGKTRCS